jgi:hypothetical protein
MGLRRSGTGLDSLHLCATLVFLEQQLRRLTPVSKASATEQVQSGTNGSLAGSSICDEDGLSMYLVVIGGCIGRLVVHLLLQAAHRMQQRSFAECIQLLATATTAGRKQRPQRQQ